MPANVAGRLSPNVRRYLFSMLVPQAPQELAACGVALLPSPNATASKGRPQQPLCFTHNHLHQTYPRRHQLHLVAPAAWSVPLAASRLVASSSSSPFSPPSLPPEQPFLNWATYQRHRRLDGRRYATRSWAAAQSDSGTPACTAVGAAAAAAGAFLAGLTGMIADGQAAGFRLAGSSPPPPPPLPGIAAAAAAAAEGRIVAAVAGAAPAGATRVGFGGRSAPAAALRLQNQEPAAVAPADTCAASSTAPSVGGGQLGSPNGTTPTTPTAAAMGGRGGQRPAAAQPPAPAPAFLEGSAYGVYDAEGALSSFDALLASLDSFDVVLLGEYHDDPVAHHLQLRVLQHVLCLLGPGGEPAQHGQQKGGSPPGQEEQGGGSRPRRRRPVALSLEMFERDVQVVMDEYLAGALPEADFLKDARPWPNYKVDYRPLVLAAKQAGAPVVCANAPRRYVGLVGRSGATALESLPPASRQHLPPLPLRPASRMYAAKISWTMQRVRKGEDGDDGLDGEEVAAPPAAPNPPGAANAAAAPAAAAPAPAAAVAAAAASTPSAASREGAGSGGGASCTAATDGGRAAADSPSGSSSGSGCPYIGLTVRSNFLDAQNLWDATMAASIVGALEALARAEAAEAGAQGSDGGNCSGGSGDGDGDGGVRDRGRPLVVHVCGKFHSEQRLGICEHLATLMGPEARVGVVTFVPSGRGVDVPSATLVAASLHTYGDWLVLTDARLPRSFESEHPV